MVQFPELRILILVGCTALKELPNSITKSGHLRFLDLSDSTSLETMPHDIGCLNELEILIPQGCLKLIHPSESMGRLRNLIHLSLSNCSNLISLPESIGSCVKLSLLNMKECISLVKLPHSVGSLRNLELLMTIGCSRLTDFPGSMKKCSKLKYLWLGGRELKALPLFIEHLAGTLEHLHIYRSSIESLPEFVFKLTKLQAMTILGCHLLFNIPESINGLKGTLKNLRFVHCSGLIRLPESLGDITNVEILDVQACQHLEALPKALGRLSKLHFGAKWV